MTRSEPIADADVAAPFAVIKRGSAMLDRIPMIPQTKSRSTMAKPAAERTLTNNLPARLRLQMACPHESLRLNQ